MKENGQNRVYSIPLRPKTEVKYLAFVQIGSYTEPYEDSRNVTDVFEPHDNLAVFF